MPVIDHPGVPRMQAGLIKKHLEPAPFLRVIKLVVLNPFDQPVESTVRFFFGIRAVRNGIRF